MIRSRRTAGTSLVEILVVIVVFLIGVLAVVQIFPGGFRLLGLTRSQSVGDQLTRSEIERLKAMGDQLPEKIIPVSFLRSGGQVLVLGDSSRLASDLGPAATLLNADGTMENASGVIGSWHQTSGANVITRIIGEGGRVPAPRPIGNGPNQFYGGLMNLQFGPIRMNSTIGTDDPLAADLRLVVYGNDLVPVRGAPTATSSIENYQYWVDQAGSPTAVMYIPQVVESPVLVHPYRIGFTAYIDGPTPRALDVVDYRLQVSGSLAPSYATVDFMTIVAPYLGPGESFVGVEFDSIQLNRVFERIPKYTGFDPNQPYQYKLMDDINGTTQEANTGSLLFNPAAYDLYVPDAQGKKIPLTARANYNVFDWGIIRDDVRVPYNEPYLVKLKLSSLKVKGNQDTDGRPYNGLGFAVANGSGGSQELDVVVMDTETGAILSPDSYRVDKSRGTISFLDSDTGTAGLQVVLFDPDSWGAETLANASGRSFRVLYQSSEEYQVQVLTAAARYIGVNAIPSFGQITLGNPAVDDQATKIFFPWCDLGRKVSIGEAYYSVSGSFVGPVTFSGVVQAPRATDSVQLPSIDLRRDYDPSLPATGVYLDSSKYGYAVRYVRGASVAVRVLWNPAKFSLGSDPAANMNAFDKWGQNWRRSITETYLQKGGQQ